jgi:hypothetical protein
MYKGLLAGVCTLLDSVFVGDEAFLMAPCAIQASVQSDDQHWPCAQELENLKTGGGGDAEAAAAAARLGEAASPQQSTGTEFSPQGRVVQLADLPASALPTTDSAPPVTAASASVKTISESAHSTQVWPTLQAPLTCGHDCLLRTESEQVGRGRLTCRVVY